MQDFVYFNPTRIVFGKGSIGQLSGLLAGRGRILLLYGGGSIFKNGVYGQVKAALTGLDAVEFGGIEPNPDYDTCLQAVELVRREGVSFVLAVGGGSVMDAAKFIAAAACHQGDPWEILETYGQCVREQLPVGTVLTLPATGSEANMNAVISRRATAEKRAFYSEKSLPVFSILDPETTFSLPDAQVRNGLVDAYVHVCEQYVTADGRAPLQDRFAEGILQTLIEVGPVTLQDKKDYASRASFVWSATLALNMLIGKGVTQDWATHMTGHELTALYGLAHAETLAVVLPGVWAFCLAQKRKQLEQYGRRVFQVAGAEEAIEATEQFFRSLGMPTRLSDYGINAQEAGNQVAGRFRAREACYGESGNIDADAVQAILLSRQ